MNTKVGALEYERMLVVQQRRAAEQETVAAPAPPPIPSFKDFSETWFEDYVTVNCKPSDRASKRRTLDQHLLPVFGDKPLDEIKRLDIERYKAAKLREGYVAKTVNNHLTILRRCLAVAVEWEVTEALPRVQWLKASKPEFDFFDAEEAEQLLAACSPGSLVEVMIRSALRTGLRRGELLGLQWPRVDFRTNSIAVVEAVSEGVLTDTKSHRVRRVPMAADLRESLQAWRHLRGPFVFCNDDGSPLTTNQVKRIVPDACKAAGLRAVNWHALRHSFASQLAMAGATLKAVQDLLGHATMEMTMRYAHLSPSHLTDAVALLGPEGRGHKMVTRSDDDAVTA